jgi:hypothetical protein
MKKTLDIDTLETRLIKGVVIAGGLFLGYRIITGAIKRWKERNTSALADQSPEVRQAMGLRSAMNPSGISWLMWTDGTNETAIKQIATQIQNLDSVAIAYRNLYQGELIKDLQSELASQDFNAFLQSVSNNRINTSSGNGSQVSPGGAYTSPQKLIVAKQTVFVRTSPDASYHGAWYEVGENKNIFKTAKAGEFVGYATGKQHYDATNDVKFIEVAYKVASSGVPSTYAKDAGKTRLLWVSASSNYVEQFSSAQTMEARYPSTKGVTLYLLPVGGLGWLSLAGSRVVSTAPAVVMDERFRPISSVDANVLLGYPVMSMSGQGHEMTLFRTLEGRDRWVDSRQVQHI